MVMLEKLGLVKFRFVHLTRYFFSSAGVGQYSSPLRFVTHKQAPDLLSSFISSKVPDKYWKYLKTKKRRKKTEIWCFGSII